MYFFYTHIITDSYFFKQEFTALLFKNSIAIIFLRSVHLLINKTLKENMKHGSSVQNIYSQFLVTHVQPQ